MVKLVSLKEMGTDAKIEIIRELGYDTDGMLIYDEHGTVVMDPYIKEPVYLDNMAILPGSTIILDNNPISLAEYMEDYGELLTVVPDGR